LAAHHQYHSLFFLMPGHVILQEKNPLMAAPASIFGHLFPSPGHVILQEKRILSRNGRVGLFDQEHAR